MKKSAVLAGAVILVAAAYTGVSWYVGLKAEETIRAAVDQANDRMAKSFGPGPGAIGTQIRIAEYRRGVFSSTARYTLSVQDGDDRYELGLGDHMMHGPFPWALVQQGEFRPLLAYSRSQLIDTESVKRWFDAARGVMPLEVRTRIGFGGDGVSTWAFAPLEWAVEGDLLSFSGGQLTFSFLEDFRETSGEGRFASLVLGDGDSANTLSLNDIRFDSRTVAGAGDVLRMNSRLTVATASLKEASDETLKVTGVAVTFDSTRKGSVMDASVRYDLGGLHVAGIDFGSVSVGGKLGRFDVDAFTALIGEYDAIARAHEDEEEEGFDLSDEEAGKLLARLRPFLAPSPEAAIEPVVWRNAKGQSTLALSVGFQPLPAEVETPDDALVKAIRELRIEVVLSRAMFLQAAAQMGGDAEEKEQLEMFAALMFDQYLDQLAAEGLVDRDDDRATMKIVYRDGTVEVNGQKMTVEEFMELVQEFSI